MNHLVGEMGDFMYRRQKGFITWFPNIISRVLLLLASYLFVELIYTASKMAVPILIKIITPLFPWGLFSLPILYYASKFPDLKFTNEGLRYRYLMFFHGMIRWEEVTELFMINHPKSMRGVYALVIEREGFRYPFWFKGLYFQTMHAIQLRTYSPVLLITHETITDEEKKKIKETINKSSVFDDNNNRNGQLT